MATTSLEIKETAMLVSRSNFWGSTFFPESPFAPPEKGAYRHSEIAFAAATASLRLPVRTMTRLTEPSEPTTACIRTSPRAFVLGQSGYTIFCGGPDICTRASAVSGGSVRFLNPRRAFTLSEFEICLVGIWRGIAFKLTEVRSTESAACGESGTGAVATTTAA